MSGFDDFLNHVMGRGRPGPSNGDGRLDFSALIGQFVRHAGAWAAVSASGIKCTIEKRLPDGSSASCQGGAIAACVVCHQPVCFNHSMIGPADGNVICFGCVGRLQNETNQRQSAGGNYTQSPFSQSQPEDKRKKYLGILGLNDPVSNEEIKSAFRMLAKKYHPDKHKAANAKKAAEKKFKLINEAFSWLSKNGG